MANTGRVVFEFLGIDKLGSVVKGIHQKFESLSEATSHWAHSLEGVASILGVGFGIREFVEMNREYEKLNVQLATFVGNARDGAKAYQAISDFAVTTPFTLDQNVEAYIDLRRAGIVPTIKDMERLGNMAAATGHNIADVADGIKSALIGIVRPLETASGAQIHAQNDKFIVAYQGQRKEIARTKEALMDYLRTLADDHYQRAMERSMNTINGAVSNFEDNLFRLASTVGAKGGINRMIVDMIHNVTKFMQGLVDDAPRITWWGKTVVVTIKTIATAFMFLVKTAWNAGKAIGYIFKGLSASVLGDFVEMINKVATFFNNFLTGLSIVSGGVINIKGRLNDYADDLHRMRSTSAAAWSDLGGVLNDFTDDLVGFNQQNLDFFHQITSDIPDGIRHASKLGEDSLKGLGKQIASVTNDEKDAKQELQNWINAFAKLAELNRNAIRPEDWKKAIRIVAQLTKEAAHGATVEVRAEAEENLKKLNEVFFGKLNKDLRAKITLDVRPPSVKLPVPKELDTWGKLRNSIHDAAEELNDYNSLQNVGTRLFDQFGSAMADSFGQAVLGSKDAGKAMRDAVLGAVGDMALAKGKFFAAEALADLAVGDFRGAALHGLAAAGMFALAGGLSAIGSHAGSYGGGGGGSTSTSDTSKLSDTNAGTATVIVQGSPIFDISDPKRVQQFARMMESISGRRIVIKQG